MARSRGNDLLLGEWACLGILYPAPMHGFAVAALLKPEADIGRVWSLSRPLTYRSLDQLATRRLIVPVGEEPGVAGPNRTLLALTRSGRAQLRSWLRTPVGHVRDLRSELLLKVVLARRCGVDVSAMLGEQLHRAEELAASLAAAGGTSGGSNPVADPGADTVVDPVAVWRSETADAAVRALRRLQGG